MISVTIDPATFKFSDTVEEVVLNKSALGVGISLDGGRGSVYGDRPIVVKSVFEGEITSSSHLNSRTNSKSIKIYNNKDSISPQKI